VSTTITFYDLLGVADAAIPRDAAAAKWPSHLVQGTTGHRDHPDPEEAKLLVDALQIALTFRNVRPGADPNRVGLTAEMLVGAVPPPLPFVLATLPDVEFRLLPTSSNPARVTVTTGDLGTEFLIEALPIEIRLPIGFVKPLAASGAPPPPSETQIDSFVSGQHDTLRIELKTNESSVIRVHVKIRMTEEGKFVIEPAVPLSIGPCRFLGLPCRALHDVNLFPAPLVGVGPGDERHFGDQALEWTRHPLLRERESEFGLATVRTVDLDDTRDPLSNIREEVNPQNAAQRFEWVLEDLAFPIGKDPVPIPSHFLIGLRRELKPGDDPAGAYNLSGLAIPLTGPASILHFKYLVIEQLLLRSVPAPDVFATTGDKQFAFLKMALVNDPAGEGHGVTIDLTDEWTVLAGWRHQPRVELFKLFSATFGLLGVRLGLSLQRISNGKSLIDSGVVVVDIEISLGSKDKPGQQAPGVCKLEGEADAPKGLVIHDFGVRFGSFSVGSFWMTGGAKLKAFDVIRLEIEEFGLITEPTGALYFGFSGSIPLPAGCDAGKPVSSAETAGWSGKIQNGVGFRFYRLRGKVAGADEAPFLLIDGIGISIRYGKLGLTGFGVVSEYVLDGHRYKEAGLSIEVRFPVGVSEIILGGLFFHGTVRGPVNNFTYYMIGLHVSPIPLSAITLTDVRLLFAWNMTPNLGPADAGSASAMRLFEWYKTNQSALALPSNRNMGAGGWKPEAETYTIAVGAKIGIGTRGVTIDAFFVYLKTATGNGLLVGFEIFLLASKKPIGFAVLEIDGDRWSVSAGLSVGTANIIGKPVPFLSDAPLLTGTFYHTNKPTTTAIGQFQDPSTWLALHIGGGFGKTFDRFTLELFVGVCFQYVDLPEGPRVFALRTSLTGGSRLFVVGGIDFYLTLELMAGVWRTESKVSGFMVFFEGGLNIDVFYVFNFGASVRVECSYLGPDPTYRHLACEVKVHTPWWLPDVTFRWTSKTGAPALEQMRVLATPVIEASAKQLSVAEATPMPGLSPVTGTAIDPAAVYSINELASASGVIPTDALARITPVSVDSSLALHFKSSVNDRLVFGQNTVAGIGGDRSSDVSTLYDLVELGIRRRPVGSANWIPLIDPAQSRIESLNGLPPNVVQQRIRQKVRMRWDADFQREGKPDARHLLINTDAPYWVAVLNLEGDEALVRNTPGWPCCGPRAKPVWHTLDFNGIAAGARVPPVQFFTASRSTLHWTLTLPPIAGVGLAAGSGVPSVARLNADSPPEGVFARLAFAEIAQTVEIRVAWTRLNRSLVVRAYRGLKLIQEQRFVPSQIPPVVIAINSPDGVTSVTLAFLGGPAGAAPTDFWLEFVQFRFRSVAEVQNDALEDGRCQSAGSTYAKPGGRFAWLPNHEYEVSFKTRVTVRHEQSGELVRETPQTLLFRTKGMPGLNQSARIGEEFEPYVESVYPGPGRPLYRAEPLVLALNERSDIFRLPDTPQPDDPPERKQQVDWVLIVSRVGGSGPAERISRSDADWIVAHRGTVLPPTPGRRPIDVGLVAAVNLRRARSLDPQWLRFEAVLASPSSCHQAPLTPPSRALMHRPYDPANPAASPAFWPPRSLLRAGVQIRGGPFIERTPFAAGDETALLINGGGPWQVINGAIGPATNTGAVLSLAIFGDAAWRNFHLTALVDPQGGFAGVAAAVFATAVLFVVDEGARRVRMLRSAGGVDTEVTSAALPDGLQAPFTLDVTAYDDAWQASVGAAQITAPRGLQENGRQALAVRGAGRVLDLRVEAVDIYRFDFVTSRYPDFAAHIASWPGTIATLHDVAPATSTLAALLAGTPLATLMQRGSDPQLRQRAFDQWTAALGVPLRHEVERLELSRRAGAFLLLESPEPLPFSEDVTLAMVRINGAVRTPVPLSILSDGAETRAYLIPAVPFTPGQYEITWSLARDRYRVAVSDAGSRFTQQAVTALVL
jgi:hypothetical protein